ncbi:conserved protein, unknown function, partial [Hepatocystis sp. ex Piliocolobus tephrosceles]
YIIDLNKKLKFTKYNHFKFLLDEILFKNKENKVFIYSYLSSKPILSLLIFYIVTTLNYTIDDTISYIQKIIYNFSMPIEDIDQIYYFTIRHKLTYYPGEYTTYLDVKD